MIQQFTRGLIDINEGDFIFIRSPFTHIIATYAGQVLSKSLSGLSLTLQQDYQSRKVNVSQVVFVCTEFDDIDKANKILDDYELNSLNLETAYIKKCYILKTDAINQILKG